MWLIVVRVLVVALFAHAGWAYAPLGGRPGLGLALGALLGLSAIALELKLRTVPGPHMVGALVGGVTGLVGARLLRVAVEGLEIAAHQFVHSALVLFLVYMGTVIGALKGEWFEPGHVVAAFRDSARLKLYKILDTSVIIDGRIADICETGFLDGVLVVPQFVLRELQKVADSADALKRNRGRRGLDILQKIQKMAGMQVQIVETDFPELKEVDLKLIELARRMSGKIVTNDFNLNKVAQLRGVRVLNINDLANSLKPVVLPGEVLRVFVVKEGKEAGQGVGYLDDGTMVVVDQARRALGKTIDVSVTSVLQTTAGKMIFCRWLESGAVVEGDDSGRYRIPDRREGRGEARPRGERRESERAVVLDSPTPVRAEAEAGPAPPEPRVVAADESAKAD
jgi:uncharacterized protein YacL